MSMRDITHKLLQIPEETYELVDWEQEKSISGKEVYFVSVRMRTEEAACAYCGTYTKQRYDYCRYLQSDIHHLSTYFYDIRLCVEKRRWFCGECERSFVETIPLVARSREGDRRRSVSYTTLFEQYICNEWAALSISELGRRTGLSESCLWSIIEGIDIESLLERGRKELDDHAQNDICLAIDEHARSGREMMLSITNHRTGHVIAVLPNTKKETLKAWVNSLPPRVLRALKGVTIDMNNYYLKTVIEAAGLHVVGIVDHFHGVLLANHMMDETRDLHAWMLSEGYYGPLVHPKHGKKAAQKKHLRKGDEEYECTKYRTHVPSALLAAHPEWKEYRPDAPGFRPITADYYLQEKYRTLFLTAEERLTEKQKHRIKQIFTEFDPHHHLADAYACKEKLRDFYREKDPSILDDLIATYKDSTHFKIKPFIQTLMKWVHELKAYCTYQLTNAIAEGKNTKAKLFKRAAYGYKTAKNYAKKLMWVQ